MIEIFCIDCKIKVAERSDNELYHVKFKVIKPCRKVQNGYRCFSCHKKINPTETKLTDFDPEKVYSDLVKYYIDKKHYDLEHANAIAQSVVNREKQKRGITV